jgi:putative signal transducing protein
LYCPNCRGEFREGITRCPDCGVDLVAELPPPQTEELEWQDTAVVYETNDPSAMLIAKSILESADIPFVSVGDRSQDLLGVGRLFAGSNPIVGLMRIEVPSEYRDEARKLLEPIAPSDIAPTDTGTSEA